MTDHTHQILDYLVDQLSKTLGDMNARIRALEDDIGVNVLDEIDWERQYEDGQLGAARSGLFQYSAKTGTWTCVVDAIHQVEAVDGKFRLHRSSGEILETAISRAAKNKAA